MARGNARRMGIINPPTNNQAQNKKATVERKSTQTLLNEIESSLYGWGGMPHSSRIKSFLLKDRVYANRLNLRELIIFWSSPVMSQCAMQLANVLKAINCSWFLAMRYLELGMVREARAMTLNFSFLQQSQHTPVETMREMCGEDFQTIVTSEEAPLYAKAQLAIETPQLMRSHLLNGIPNLEQRTISSLSNISINDYKTDYIIDHVSDDWKSSSSSSNHRKPCSKTLDGTRIKLSLVSDTNRGEHAIGSSTPLKVLFNEYAEERDVSLRSLRFSYRGKTLFLSSIGNKTPDELNMQDQDVILVHDNDTSMSQQLSSGSSSNQTNNKSTSKKSKVKNRPRKNKGKNKTSSPTQAKTVKMTLEEHKAQHSMILTKLHEEVQPRLKEIRNRLNVLDLDRQSPKQKKKRIRRKNKVNEQQCSDHHLILPNSGIGGKAGKPYFMIQVGNVDNLYKTQKSQSCHHLQHSSSVRPATAMIDLHGYTKTEALVTLNEHLPEWVDVAMKGNYPWAIPVKIVCGCGNQILSETVQEWIKSSRNVSNAPKNSILC